MSLNTIRRRNGYVTVIKLRMHYKIYFEMNVIEHMFCFLGKKNPHHRMCHSVSIPVPDGLNWPPGLPPLQTGHPLLSLIICQERQLPLGGQSVKSNILNKKKRPLNLDIRFFYISWHF